ncbi:MAG: hypothetical protein FWF44_01345 [Defluviitaleaceae bacterium]|nr:hypothetical protein [Defluviitaleaceae bacterium]
MEKLYRVAQGYRKRYPKGDEPFQMVTRLLEECGEVASEVNLWEGSGIKRRKRGVPCKEDLAGEIKQAMAALLQIADYYQVKDELEDSINKSYERMESEGLFD